MTSRLGQDPARGALDLGRRRGRPGRRARRAARPVARPCAWPGPPARSGAGCGRPVRSGSGRPRPARGEPGGDAAGPADQHHHASRGPGRGRGLGGAVTGRPGAARPASAPSGGLDQLESGGRRRCAGRPGSGAASSSASRAAATLRGRFVRRPSSTTRAWSSGYSRAIVRNRPCSPAAQLVRSGAPAAAEPGRPRAASAGRAASAAWNTGRNRVGQHGRPPALASAVEMDHAVERAVRVGRAGRPGPG